MNTQKDINNIEDAEAEANLQVNKLINIIIQTLTELSKILEQENHLLKEKKISDIEKLQDRKEVLITKMESFKELQKQQPELFNKFPVQKQSELTNLILIFNKVIKENYDELAKARLVNNIVLDSVKLALKKHVTEKENYDDAGNNNGNNKLP
ncbi:MAG: hypothetical protein AAF195_01045, partial [Pseudomonadota bacterium]